MEKHPQPYVYEHGAQYSKELNGKPEQRVFVGGHYDFMPIIRFIAECVAEIPTPAGDPFIPIIPYFHRIDPHKVMEEDRWMVDQCGRAIFETSDLGGQLVEMEQALRSHKPTLVVYGVREDEDLDPERGRLTVTTCGHPFASYVSFDELREKIRVFLLGLKERGGYVIRRLASEEREHAIFRIHTLVRDGKYAEAKEEIDTVNSQGPEGVLDAWLALALIVHREGDPRAVRHALQSATNAATDDHDMAEIAYCRGLIAVEQKHWEKATRELGEALELKPSDPRILVLRGFAFKQRGGQRRLKTAMTCMENALREIEKQPAPETEIQRRMATLTTMQAKNNLAYYCCLLVETVQDRRKQRNLAQKALELSEDLPVYHRRFRRRNAAWLHTRGCALLLNAQLQRSAKLLEEAKTILGHARAMEMDPRVEDNWQRALQLTTKLRLSGSKL